MINLGRYIDESLLRKQIEVQIKKLVGNELNGRPAFNITLPFPDDLTILVFLRSSINTKFVHAANSTSMSNLFHSYLTRQSTARSLIL